MSSAVKSKHEDDSDTLRKSAEDMVRKLYGIRARNARVSAICGIDVELLGEIVELLSELISMPETVGHAAGYKVLSSLHKACSDRLNYLHGKMAADEEERRIHSACSKHIDMMPRGCVERFKPVGSTGKPTWLMKTYPLDGNGPDRFLLLNSDMCSITKMDTKLTDVLERGRLYRAEIRSAVIVRYMMSAVVKDEDGDKNVLLQIPEWILRTAAERMEKYKGGKQ